MERSILISVAVATLLFIQGTAEAENQPQSNSAPQVSVSPASVAAGKTVTVTIANGPGNLKDWVCLYKTGAAHDAYLGWFYLNGDKTVPASGLKSATLSWTMPCTAGTYEFRLFSNGGYGLLAKSPNVTVTGSAAGPSSTLVVSPASVESRGTVTVTVARGPGNPRDWVGVYKAGAADTDRLEWFFLDGSKTAPGIGVASATLKFTMPLMGGTYEFRFFADDAYALLARSPSVTVIGPTIELVGDPVLISDTPRYCAFTDMVRLARSGDLLAVYFAGSGHMDGASTIEARLSSDDGKTWGAPATLVPSIKSGYGVRDPHIVQLPDGTLLLNYFSYPKGENSVRTFVISSTDNGRTWSKPDLIDVGAPSLWVATCGKILVLKSGTLLLPLYFKLQNNDGTVGTLRSRDGGKTWGELVIVQKNNTEGEMEMAQLPDGSLVAMIRPCGYATSHDEGATWSKPANPVATSPNHWVWLAAPGLLVDGPLLLMNYRGGSPSDGCSIGLSLDGGKTWPVSRGLCPEAGINTAYGTIIKTKPGSPAPYFTIFYRSPDDDPVFTTKIVGRYFKVIMP